MRLIFMGTAEFGLATLRVLHENHEIAAVITRCDVCMGRGRKLCPTPVKSTALDLGIPVYEQDNLSDPDFITSLRELDADLFYVVAFKILPKEVFTIPPKGTVNLHASLLPDYRGAAPVNWAIINGDNETGLTTFYIEEKVDTGDVILNESVTIGPDETAGELSDRMKVTGAELSLKTADMIEQSIAPRIKQPFSGGRPAPKLFKEDGRINWSRDAQIIHNQVRGMNPRPGAFTESAIGNLKIHRTIIMDTDSPGTPGLITEVSQQSGLTVSCGKGELRILKIQPPGKKPMDGASFHRGYRIEKGVYINKI
ncbi:methionyl-tRNA formyltransferase [Candidatus Latescibacterota bacterium]